MSAWLKALIFFVIIGLMVGVGISLSSYDEIKSWERNRKSYNRAGYDAKGYDRGGFDKNGYSKDFYKRPGFEMKKQPDKNCTKRYGDCPP